ncbi:MAG: hypothetical protein Phog2KO_15800 [Phototrophicaceae bacterium]
MYTNNDILFPHSAIASLRGLRDKEWNDLVEHILTLPETHEETLAFMLTMIRLNSCIGCETDSYRAMRGCSACSIQTLRRFKDDDSQLMTMYEQALKDIRTFAYQTDTYTILMSSNP